MAWLGIAEVLWDVIYYVVVIGAAIAYGDYKRRLLNRQIRDAWNAGLRDRNITIQSTEAPKTIAYGEVTTGGIIWYWGTFGADGRNLYLGLLLGPGHEIYSIDALALNNQWLSFTNDEVSPGDSIYNAASDDNADSGTFVATGGVQTVTVAHDYLDGSLTVMWMPDWINIDSQPGYLSATRHSSNSFDVDTTGLTGRTINYSYRWRNYTPLVKWEKHLGHVNETASAWLIADTEGEVTSAEKGEEVPYIILRLIFNETAFANGIPPIKIKFRGKKVYDPRRDSTVPGGSGTHRNNDPTTWEYITSGGVVLGENNALCVRDYLTSPLGYGANQTEIDDQLIIAAANICDELIPDEPVYVKPDPNLPGYWTTGSRKRYTCNGIITTDSDCGDNLDVLASSMGGVITYAQGKWRVYAGAYRSPTITLNSNNILGKTVTVQAKPENGNIFNCVKGQFIDPFQSYELVDYPVIIGTSYIEEDNGERIFFDYVLPMTNDGGMAQRLALLALEQARQSLTMKCTFDMSAYKLWPGLTFNLIASEFGWPDPGKEFRVVEREFALYNQGPTLTFVEEAEAVYTATEPSSYDIAPNTTFRNVSIVDVIGGIVLDGDGMWIENRDGSVNNRLKITWTQSTDPNVLSGGHIEGQYQRLSALDEWVPVGSSVPGDATVMYANGLAVNDAYQVRLRAINAIGAKSQWAYSDFYNLPPNAAPLPPTDLAMIWTAGPTLRRYTWNMPYQPRVSNFRLVWKAGATITWETAEAGINIAGVRATGSSVSWWYEAAAPAAGTWSFEIRSVDDQGRVSASGSQLLNQTLPLAGIPPDGSVTNVKLPGAPFVGNILSPDPGFEDLSAWIMYTGTTYERVSISGLGTITGLIGRYALRSQSLNCWVFTPPIPIDNKRQFRVIANATRGASGDNRLMFFSCRFKDESLNDISGDTDAAGWPSYGTFHYWGLTGSVPPLGWTEYSQSFGPNGAATYGIPTNAKFVCIGALITWDGGGSYSGTNYMNGLRLIEINNTDLISPNAITKVYPANTAGGNPCNRDLFTGAHDFWSWAQECNSGAISMKAGERIVCEVALVGYMNSAITTQPGVGIDVVVTGSGKVKWHVDTSDNTGNVDVTEDSLAFAADTNNRTFRSKPYIYVAPSDQEVTVYGAGGIKFGSSTSESGQVFLTATHIKR